MLELRYLIFAKDTDNGMLREKVEKTVSLGNNCIFASLNAD